MSGHRFPRCGRCEHPVAFQLVRATPDLDLRGSAVELYYLPETSGS